ncbi:MAG TPA: multicopper oxidase family protein, partial [archaeon]|nr:multicopper oxidase family protein [archaeon]
VGNAFDGVPALTQNPVLPGEGFSYELDFPDPGMYWYHPHLQEARQQELGLYGVILVEPEKEDYYGKASREEVLVLDDILLDNGAPTFIEGVTTHALMGRFGNVLLVNGGTGYELPAKTGEVIRFYALNAANTRVFNFKIPGARLKVVGTDVSSFESEYFADSVVIAPSERYVIEAFFEKPGEHALVHETPYGEYSLGRVIVSSENQAATESPSSSFLELKENKYVAAEVGPLKALFGKPVDVDWRLSVELQGHMGHAMSMGLGEDGIEWEDAMGSMNANLTTDSVKWVIQDRATGKENDELQYNFKKGDHVKVRIFNDPKSMHPMQHPIHFHGNRFLVLERDGVENENKAWKDTVLVPSGSAITLFLELSNPGKWMAHCHVSEHLEAGMMAQYGVA